MFDSPVYDLLSRGRAAAKAGDAHDARRYLERLLNLDPTPEERMEALYWLSEVSQDPVEQRACLEEILANNLGDARARRKLAILDGRLKPDEIVDPDHVPPPPPGAPRDAPARSFTCPKCGGKRVFAPDGQTLVCEYCESQERIAAQKSSSAAGEDFLVAMATGKAQRKPVSTRSLTCRGCGASFLLPPDALTQACPYCATPYGLEQVELREMDAPDGMIPFKVDLPLLKLILEGWFREHLPRQQPRLTSTSGTYLPAWIFTMGGQVHWTGQVYQNKTWRPLSGNRIVSEENLLIPATRRLPQALSGIFFRFDLSAVQPFDLRFLAGWLAETFQVPAAEAALDARKQAVDRISAVVKSDQLGQAIENFQLHTAQMLVDSYRLVLLPVWVVNGSLAERSFELLIDGQSGSVIGQPPHSGLSGWFHNLLDI